MAGKEKAWCGNGRAKMEGDVCWRKQVDQNLKRLHSLLFGSDLALHEGDFSSAQVLGLSLIGFLDSHSHSDVDEAFIRPIRSQVYSKIHQARRSLIPDSDRSVSSPLSIFLSLYCGMCIFLENLWKIFGNSKDVFNFVKLVFNLTLFDFK